MKDELSEQQTDAILKALDKAIEQGPWDESTFLRVIGKNLREIRNDFARESHRDVVHEQSKLAARLANRVALRTGQQEIFISLYSSDGSNIRSWERILINLPNQIISRPIYPNEDDVQNLIKTKTNQNNEAYLSIYVNQVDILPIPIDKMSIDKLGKRMLALKDKALRLENVDQFVHVSGKYRYHQGKLVKITQGEAESP